MLEVVSAVAPAGIAADAHPTRLDPTAQAPIEAVRVAAAGPLRADLPGAVGRSSAVGDRLANRVGGTL